MRLIKLTLACLVIGSCALLSACGGGGGGDGAPVALLNIKGTAAVGDPVVGTVAATCSVGSGTTTSNSDGSFNLTIANGKGPCLLSVTPQGGAPLYSFSTGTEANQTANITPLTNLLVNYFLKVKGMTADNPVAWFSLPSTIALLSNTAAVNNRIVNDFIPAIKVLLPTLSVTGVDFLSVSFITSGGSATDGDLILLTIAKFVSSTGVPSVTIIILLQISAGTAPTVPPAPTPTGSTGAGS